MNVSTGSQTVFGYFVNLVSIFGLLTWISILVSHIYFVKARRAQGVPDDSPQLRYKSPFGLWGSYFALAFCVLISLTKNFNVFRNGGFDYKVSYQLHKAFSNSYLTPNAELHHWIPWHSSILDHDHWIQVHHED